MKTDEPDLAVLHESVRGLARKVDLDYWREKDAKHECLREFVSAFADGGWLGMMIPEECGCLRLGVTEAGRMGSVRSLPPQRARAVPQLCTTTCSRRDRSSGTVRAMKKEWLPKLATGEIQKCFATTEPDAGVDTSQITTRAQRIDGGWVVNGGRVWISGAQQAGRNLLFTIGSPE